jgi:putative glycosyltransferase (TIGR04372 family)
MFQLKLISKKFILKTFLLILQLINYFFNIKFSTIAEDRIGFLTYSCNMLIRRNRITNKTFKLFIVIDKPCNTTILGLFKRELNFIHSAILKKLINNTVKDLIKKDIYFVIDEGIRCYSEHIKTPPSIFLNQNQINFGYKEINKFGISKKDWWVCFHGRDSNYLKSLYPNRSFDYHNYRDFDPNTMILGMMEVIKRGGFAIIMGDKNSIDININHDKIIFYNKKYSSDFLDVFLSAQAKFFIGNSSGLKAVSQSFNVPVAAINQIGFNLILQPSKSLTIYKKLYSINKRRLLKFDEIFNLGLFSKETGNKGFFSKYYDDNNLIPIENTSEEIRGLVSDMFNLIDKKKINTIIQKRFIKKFLYDYKDIELAGKVAPSFFKLNRGLF